MIRNRLFLKFITIFFLTEAFVSAVQPMSLFALTAGSSSPEFSSFEPVDTSDLVNLASGQLVYNMPLLEVPGPEGGYPLSLSYHSGIRPEQEASWVGLGWTLNPGAINRTVNGIADDNFNSRSEVRDYWDGGSTTTKTLNIDINYSSGSGHGENLTTSKTRDTNRGFGGGARPNTGQRWKNYHNESRASGNSTQNSEMGIGGSAALNFDISSKGVQTSLSAGGASFPQNSGGPGSISSYTHSSGSSAATNATSSSGTSVSIDLKQQYTRYWSDQTDALYSFGALYASKSNSLIDNFDQEEDYAYSEFKSYATDIRNVYEAPSADPSQWDVRDAADPTKQIGGSLPEYDQYEVLGQGVGGAIEPYIFENGDMRGQASYLRNESIGTPFTGYPTLEYKSMRKFTDGKKVDFRFRNDFSNKLTIDPISVSNSFEIAAQTVVANPDGFDNSASEQMLEGSKHVEWFTNEEIVNGQATTKHFIDCYATRSERSLSRDIYDNYMQPEACIPSDTRNIRGKGSGIVKADTYEEADFYAGITPKFQSLKPRPVSLSKKIGGFMITTESGVTYHYALPVYSYNEYTRVKMKKPRKGALTVTEIKNDEPYAYTWLLTAVTGPDFVDRGGPNDTPDGILNDDDYGYWVKFDYGKWADSYQWRTPHSGYITDTEDEYASFSYGIKELYYLDAIETKTHKALFIKSKRLDGRGVTSRLEGGSNPRKYKMTYDWPESNVMKHGGDLVFSVSPVSMLKLDAIYLYDKKDLSAIPISKNTGNLYDNHPSDSPLLYNYQGTSYSYTVPSSDPVKTVTIDNQDAIKISYHNGDQILDKGDIDENVALKALKIIRFDSDYALAWGVPNSFNYFSDSKRACTPVPNGVCPTNPNFDFEWPIPVDGCYDFGRGAPYCCNRMVAGELFSGYSIDKNAFYSFSPLDSLGYFDHANCREASGPFAGSDLKFDRTGKLSLKAIKVLGHGGADILPPTKLAYQVNPEYKNGKFDEWGFYKADFVAEPLPGQFNERSFPGMWTRRVTEESAAFVDAWSLSSITTPLGATINIDYEPNQYRQSVYNDDNIFAIESAGRLNSTQVLVRFKEKGLDLKSYFYSGQTVGVRIFLVDNFGGSATAVPTYYLNSKNIATIGSDNVVLDAPDLSEALREGHTITNLDDGSTDTAVPYFVSGALSVPDISPTKFGGGVRVRSISVGEFDGHKRLTEYGYNLPGTSTSSGVTSYKPYAQIGVHYPTENVFFENLLYPTLGASEPVVLEGIEKAIQYKTKFQKYLNQLLEKILVNGREAPGPGVVYEYVTIKNKYDGQEPDSYNVHQFEVFKESMVSYSKQDHGTANQQQSNVTIENNTVAVGNLKRIQVYSSDGSVLHETKYGYLNDDEIRSFETALKNVGQGAIQQGFHKYVTIKEYINHGFVDHHYNIETTYNVDRAVYTKRVDYSNVMTSVDERDFKTGALAVTEYPVFDFFSGQSLESVTHDAYGSIIKTESIPAYSLKKNGVSVYPEMGLKIDNAANKHMLTQQAANYVYKIDDSGNPVGLLSASAQTWSDDIPVVEPGGFESSARRQLGIWRKHSGFLFIGDDNANLNGNGIVGLYPYSSVSRFDAWMKSDNVTQGWQKMNEITLYDASSHDLTAMDVNEQFTSKRMSFDQSQVIAIGTNCEYREIGYSGAEEMPKNNQFGSDVYFGKSGNINTSLTTDAHTGKQAVVAAPGVRGFTFYTVPKQRTYHVSVWSSQNSAAIKYIFDTNPEKTAGVKNVGKAGSWFLLEADIPVIESWDRMEVWCEAVGTTTNFDDFRFHPLDASMTSYVYKPTGEVSHILDNNNIYTAYEYDAMGRLTETFRESFKTDYGQNGKARLSVAEYHLSTHDPYTVSVKATSSGSSGSVEPKSLTATQNGKATFVVKETCDDPRLLGIYIDNQLIGNGQQEITLFDGTRVNISGNIVKFINIQSAHTIEAKFADFSGLGIVQCHKSQGTLGWCMDGTWEYAYYDACGKPGEFQQAFTLDEIPADLRSQAHSCPNVPCGDQQ
jgi:hypothetical protein